MGALSLDRIIVTIVAKATVALRTFWLLKALGSASNLIATYFSLEGASI